MIEHTLLGVNHFDSIQTQLKLAQEIATIQETNALIPTLANYADKVSDILIIWNDMLQIYI
jgi:hypothetical protein